MARTFKELLHRLTVNDFILFLFTFPLSQKIGAAAMLRFCDRKCKEKESR